MADPILIVEDEFIISMLLERLVRKLGYDVLDKVSTGDKALDLMRTHPVGAVLMDIKIIGDKDGIETVETMRARHLDSPVIYVTGNSDPLTRERAMRTAPAAYLVKPVDLETLDATLKQVFS